MRTTQILKLTAFFTCSVVFSSVSEARDRRDGVWSIQKKTWSDSDERNYSDFVQSIGESGCRSTKSCLNSNSNPYKNQNPDWIARSAYADCADLPYVLRMYFAYMNDLPFSFTTGVSAIGGSRDQRYSRNGNKVRSRRVISSGESLKSTMREVSNQVSSAMFRIPPENNVRGNNLFPDFYSVKLNRKSVRPGTNIYDPNGHVAIVYKVEKDGRVLFIDGHPDNSITRGTYGAKFARSRPQAGAGFKNWRPITYHSNGQIIGADNSSIKDFSVEQYYGHRNTSKKSWKQGDFVYENTVYEYYKYVRVALAEGALKFNPPVEMRNMLQALCQDLKDRVDSVDTAIKSGIHRKAHPNKLPYNIYGTEGEWETYSTPSRDARLKTSFVELRESVAEFINLVANRSSKVSYNGSVQDLQRDLAKVYNAESAACKISYKNSDGRSVELNIEDVQERLFDLSFDPYHCIELRWGARGQELASCRDNANKMEWYKAEQRLRNQTERTYDTRMDVDLRGLINSDLGWGAAPVVDLRDLIGR